MSRVQLSRLIRDVEHTPGQLDALRADPESVIGRYDLTAEEKEAALDLDGQRLVDLGINPLLMRTFLVLNGVGNPDLYSHEIRLRPSADS